MPAPTLRVVTTAEEGPSDEAGGATGFGQRRALPSSLSIALPHGAQDLERTKRPGCLSWILTWSHHWS